MAMRIKGRTAKESADLFKRINEAAQRDWERNKTLSAPPPNPNQPDPTQNFQAGGYGTQSLMPEAASRQASAADIAKAKPAQGATLKEQFANAMGGQSGGNDKTVEALTTAIEKQTAELKAAINAARIQNGNEMANLQPEQPAAPNVYSQEEANELRGLT